MTDTSQGCLGTHHQWYCAIVQAFLDKIRKDIPLFHSGKFASNSSKWTAEEKGSNKKKHKNNNNYNNANI